MAAALPARRLEGRVRPAGHDLRAVVVPRQHRGRADRRHDGAASCSAHKVHIGYLAAIVAASNAGGSGSVVGDTTTTMMWIAGVSPLAVLEAYVAAVVALVIFGIPASLQQHALLADRSREAPAGIRIDWARVVIVAFILVVAIAANVVVNLQFNAIADSFPFIGVAVWVAILVCVPLRAPALGRAARGVQGHAVPAVAGARRVDDAGAEAAGGVVAGRDGSGLRVGGVRQHSADGAGVEARRLRLGLPRLRRGLRRLDDLVRLVGGRRAVQPVSASALRRRVAARTAGISPSRT